MTKATEFGKPAARRTSNDTARRAAAARRYDDMRAQGLPEFEVFVRAKPQQDWLLVGSLAVSRSSKVTEAIYANESDLLQGAFRRFPRLRKYPANLEYGYRLKAAADAPIQRAERPRTYPGSSLGGALRHLRDRLTGWLAR